MKELEWKELTGEYVKQAALHHCACWYNPKRCQYHIRLLLFFPFCLSAIGSLKRENYSRVALFVHHDTPKCFECNVALQFRAAVEWLEFSLRRMLLSSKEGNLFRPQNRDYFPSACQPHVRCHMASAKTHSLWVLMMMIVWQYKTFSAMMSHCLIQAFAEHEKKIFFLYTKSAKRVLFIVFIPFPPNTLLIGTSSGGEDVSENTSLSIGWMKSFP